MAGRRRIVELEREPGRARDEIEVSVAVDVADSQHAAEPGTGTLGRRERAVRATREPARCAAVDAQWARPDHQIVEAVTVQVAGHERTDPIGANSSGSR